MSPAQIDPVDDSRLTERIRASDVAAYDALLRRYWTPLVRYAASFLGSVDEGKDITQEAFVRIWEHRSTLRPSGSVRAYLYQIVRNLALNELKRRELHHTLAAREAEQTPPVRTPAGEMEASEVRAVVRRAIAALPERRRECFVLAHLQDLPHREIAEILGISRQTIANQISAALGDLRETLAPYLGRPGGRDLRRPG